MRRASPTHPYQNHDAPSSTQGSGRAASSAIPGRDTRGVELAPDGAQPLGVLRVFLPVRRRVRAHPIVVQQPHPRRGRCGSRSRRRHRAVRRRSTGAEDAKGTSRRMGSRGSGVTESEDLKSDVGPTWKWVATGFHLSCVGSIEHPPSHSVHLSCVSLDLNFEVK